PSTASRPRPATRRGWRCASPASCATARTRPPPRPTRSTPCAPWHDGVVNLDEQRRLMLSGAMYNDLTDELVQAREQTVLATDRYNASFGQPAEVREAILGELLARVGSR